jgi:hypothetical protein
MDISLSIRGSYRITIISCSLEDSRELWGMGNFNRNKSHLSLARPRQCIRRLKHNGIKITNIRE